MFKTKYFYKLLISFAVTLLIVFFTINPIYAKSSDSVIAKKLLPYKEWETQDLIGVDYNESNAFYFLCPKKNVTFKQMFNYVQDFHTLLADIDHAYIYIEFRYSPNNWKDSDDFSDNFAFACQELLNSYYDENSFHEFLGITSGAHWTNDVLDYYSADVYFDCYTENYLKNKSSQYNKFYKKAMSIVQTGLTKTNNELELATYFCDWVSNNIEYGQCWGSMNTLLKGHGFCDGQSSLLYDLFRFAGIPVKKNSSDEINHAWNSAYINGTWYTFDILNVVSSKSDNYLNGFFFTDPTDKPDFAKENEYIEECIITHPLFLNTASKININVGKSYSLKSYIRNLSNTASVKYKSSNTSIAKVNSSGKITGKKKGRTTIIVTIKDTKKHILKQKIKIS